MSKPLETKLKLDKDWGSGMDPTRHVRVPVVLGEFHGDSAGTIITPKVKPGSPRGGMFVIGWKKNAEKRRSGINTLALSEAMLERGNFFLQAAYEAEGWPEGWAAYRDWLAETEPVGKRKGKAQGQLFPDKLLPKKVLALRAKAKSKVNVWQIGAGLAHPEDKAAEDKAAEVKAAEVKAAKAVKAK